MICAKVFRIILHTILFVVFLIILTQSIHQLHVQDTNISIEYKPDYVPLPELTFCPVPGGVNFNETYTFSDILTSSGSLNSEHVISADYVVPKSLRTIEER